MIIHLKDAADFDKEIANNKNVVVDFFATWCGPCRMMGRVLEDIEEKYSNVTFVKVDTDKFPEIAQNFSVFSIPTFVAFKDGKQVNINDGGSSVAELVGGKDQDSFEELLNATFGL